MSTYYTVEAQFKYELFDHEVTIEPFLEAVDEQLVELGAEDLLLVSDEESHKFLVSLLIKATSGDSIETVVGRASGMFRTAFHTCDGHTAGWPTPREVLQRVRVTPTEIDVEAISSEGLELAAH